MYILRDQDEDVCLKCLFIRKYFIHCYSKKINEYLPVAQAPSAGMDMQTSCRSLGYDVSGTTTASSLEVNVSSLFGSSSIYDVDK